jgi:hypothetical protein
MAVFTSSKKVLCKQKILRHIKLTIHAWSTKCRSLCSVAPRASRPDSRCAQPRWTTSTPWHRAPCWRRAPRQRASIGRQQVDLHTLQPWIYVAYVSMSIHLCCKCVFQMFQLFSNVCCNWFIWMLHMLDWLYTYTASVCFQMFRLFQTYVASVLSGCCICCNRHTCMLQVYVSNISVVSNMLQVFYLDAAYVAVARRICCKSMF